jgi:O-antigen ligase
VKNSTSNLNSKDIFPVRWVYGGLIATTLFFYTTANDPFNSPKNWIILVVAAWLSGYLYSYKSYINANKPIQRYSLILLAFITFAFLSTIFTDFKHTAFFGETLRRNGFLTYLSVVLIGLATSVFIRLFNVKRLYFATLFTGFVFAIYAYLQTTGRDFIEWNNRYNSIIGTVGNPNFAAAVMSIIGVLAFSLTFIKDTKMIYRASAGILTVALIFLIVKSDSRQGILTFIIGAGLFVVILLFSKNRVLGILSSSVGLIVAIFSIL